MFAERKLIPLWAANLIMRFLKGPHRFLLGWFGGPRLLAMVSAVRAFGPKSDATSLVRPTVGLDPSSAGASLHQLRTATSNDWLWVPLEKIRSFRAQVFSADQHPYSRYLRDGIVGMEEVFKLDRPVTPDEYLFIGDECSVKADVHLGSTSNRVWPWANLSVMLPEAPSFPFWRAGPKTKSHMLDEAQRLDKILKSVQKRGYILNHAELPWFSVLLNDSENGISDYRVLVQHGNHRVAVLAHLGWELIPMAPLPTMLVNEIRLSDIGNWPGVLEGTFSIDEAKARFMAFFRDVEEGIIPGLDRETPKPGGDSSNLIVGDDRRVI